MNSYLVNFGYYQYLVQHLMNDTEGKKTTNRCYLDQTQITLTTWQYNKTDSQRKNICLQVLRN